MGKDKRLEEMPEQPHGPGRSIPPSFLQTGADIRETCKQVDVPEKYLKTFYNKGNEIESDLLKKYNCKKRKFKESIERGNAFVKDMWNKLWKKSYRDRAFESLKRGWDPDNHVLNATLKSSGKFEDRLEDYENLLDFYEDAEDEALIAVCLRDNVADEAVEEILSQKDIRDRIESHREDLVISGLIVGSLSEKESPGELYERVDELEEFYKKAVNKYGLDLEAIGTSVPRMVNELLDWKTDITDEEIQNFAENVNNTKSTIKGLDFYLLNSEDRNYDVTKHGANLYIQPMDGLDRDFLGSAMSLSGKRGEVLKKMTEIYEREGRFKEGHYQEAKTEFYSNKDV